MRMPGLEIAQVFRKVRGRVLERTDGKQTPWESSSIIGEFYFVPPTATAIAPAEAGVSPYLAAATRWKELEASTDTAALEAFAKQYEDNLFGAAARARLSQIAGQRSSSAADEAKTSSPLPAPSSERQLDAPETNLAALPPPDYRARQSLQDGRIRPGSSRPWMQQGKSILHVHGSCS